MSSNETVTISTQSLFIGVTVCIILYLLVLNIGGSDRNQCQCERCQYAHCQCNQFSEEFPIGNLPATQCAPQTFTNVASNMTPADSPDLATVDAATAAAYKTALSKYSTALADYNKIASCNPLCVGGTVDPSGTCTCANGTPYVHTDGKIYCVPIDLSSVPNTVFNTATSNFECKPGYSQTVAGDNMCYNTANTTKLKDYITQLNNASSSIINSAKTITSAYGKVGNFYISGSATLPPNLVQISQTTGVKTTALCASGAPQIATMFVYDPKTQVCTYYSNPISLSSLSIGTATVGSITL